MGKVHLSDRASVWYGAVVRGDKNKVMIGTRSAVMDRAVISCVSELESGFPSSTSIGNFVTIGPGALVTSCTVEDEVAIGAGAIIDTGCVIEKQSIVAPGSVVAAGTLIPSGQYWAGNPAKFVRNLSDSEKESFQKIAAANAQLAEEHSQEFLPFGTLYQNAEKQQ